MTLKKSSVRMLALASCGILPSLAFAQTQPAQPDIVGLKLGMTMSQAEAVLEKYNPALKLVPISFRASTSEEISQYASVAPDSINASNLLPDLVNAKVKFPIGLQANSVTHFYSQYPATEMKPGDTDPVGSVSGEFFDLDFTPTDDGGRLYAISHVTAYPPTATISADGIKSELAAKYGAPSETGTAYGDGGIDIWIYDQRGRQLPTSHPDYLRCRLAPDGMTEEQDSLNGYREGFFKLSGITIAQFNESSGMVGFAPDFLTITSNPSARGCGVQLYAQYLASANDQGVPYVMVTLSDQNTAFFNNGVQAYATKKLSAVAPAALAPAPNL